MLYSEVTARADSRGDAMVLGATDRALDVIHPLRPMTGSEPLDLGVMLFRVLGRILVPLTVALYLPIEMAALWLRPTGEGSAAMFVLGLPIGGSDPGSAWFLLILFLHGIALSSLGMTTGVVLGYLVDRRPFRTGPLVLSVLRRLPTAVVIVTMTFLLQAVASCIPVAGYFVVAVCTFVTSIVAGAEGVGPWRALRRSVSLVRASSRFAVGLFLGGLVIVWIARIVLMAGPLALLAVMGLPDSIVSLTGYLDSIVMVVAQPLTATMAGAAYLALRIRSEGLDLRYRVHAMGGVG